MGRLITLISVLSVVHRPFICRLPIHRSASVPEKRRSSSRKGERVASCDSDSVKCQYWNNASKENLPGYHPISMPGVRV